MSKTNRGAIAWMVNNPVAANLLMLICIFGGLFSIQNAKQEVFPEYDLDQIRISVAYPGASPEEVEKGIVKPIEEAISGLDGIKESRGNANEGSGNVVVEIIEGENVQEIATDIRTEVDRIRTFPDDAEESKVNVVSRKRQVIDLVLYGEVSREALKFYSEIVRDELLADPKITQVDISGLPPLEISINVAQETLRRYNLSIQNLAQRIRGSSIDLPFGGIKASSGEILLRMKERRDYGDEFEKIPIISSESGTEIFLGDIATIHDGFEESDYVATFEGQPSVMVEVFRVGEQTPLEVAEAVRNKMDSIHKKLPSNINVSILRDRSTIFAQRINLLLRNAFIGLILVLFSLGLFMEIRLAFWVMMGIPISFLGAFILLPSASVSINMISLFAFIITLGIVVDDAIIVGENIYQYREQGMGIVEAAAKGANEMAVPITFSILTNIATFMPLYFMPGRIGKFFWQIPVVAAIVFFISLFESLFVLPAHLGHEKKRPEGAIARFQGKFSRLFRTFVEKVYQPILGFLIEIRYVVLAFSIAILMISYAWTASGRMGFQSFPKIESDRSEVQVVMPYGTPVEKTQKIAQDLIASAQRVRDRINASYVTGVFSEVGKDGSHSIRIRVYLVDAEEREKIGISTDQFTQDWRKESGPILGAEYSKFASDAGGPGGGRAALNIELSHTDTKVLEKASREVAARIQELEYVEDVDDGYQPGKRQLDFQILSEGKVLGLTSLQIARQLRNTYYGAEVVRQLRGQNEVKVRVRLLESQRQSEYNLNEMIVRTSAGREVMLRDVATWEEGYAYTTIKRRNGKRVVQVTGDVSPRSKALEVITRAEEILPEILQHYPGLSCSFEGRQADRRESLSSLQTTFLFAMFIVYALLAIPFRSYIQPIIVMYAIPFGFVGAILGHLLMGYALSIPSVMGIIALSGVVVNDSLILVDCINRNREKAPDKNLSLVVLESSMQRFRPIVLTTLTTFCGLITMIFETSRQAKFLIPMAVSLGFGIVFATLITLILVPCCYLIIEDLRWLKSNYYDLEEHS